MYLPNSDCKVFCEWMISGGIARLTSSQKNITNDIITAVDTVTPVSNVTWKNFLLYSPQYYSIWKQSIELATIV